MFGTLDFFSVMVLCPFIIPKIAFFFFGLIKKSEVSLVISEKNCAKSKFFYSDKNICFQVVF